MKTYEQINQKITSRRAVVLTAEEVTDYVKQKGLEKAAEEIDVVTTATFGPMCSSGCFLNFGHTRPKMRISEAWLDDVPVYCGVAAVDAYLGATQLRANDPANLYYPGEFRFGGGHVIEKLVRGESVQLFGLSYGTDCYPRREVRTYLTLKDLNQAIMVNPRNCYQNYNVAVNSSENTIYTYMGTLKPGFKNATFCSAAALSPLLNDPYLNTIGIGSAVWLAGARGHVYAEGTQHTTVCERGPNGVPKEGAGTLALTADLKKMKAEYVRGVSLKGYGVSLALGIGVPIPVLNPQVLQYTLVSDSDLYAPLVDYGRDYPQGNGKILGYVSYAQLKSGEIKVRGKTIEVGSLSSVYKAHEIAQLLKTEILQGEFLLAEPSSPLTVGEPFKPMTIKNKAD